MAEMAWCEVTIEVPVTDFELVADSLQEAGSGGVVFQDPSLLENRKLEQDEVIDESLCGQTEALIPAVKAYFPVDDRLGKRLETLKVQLGSLLGIVLEFGLRRLDEENWANAWKRYYKPEKIGQVVIKPSWEEYAPVAGETVVELDPGMAFGTGTHPTTRLCLGILQELIHHPLRMLDLGTGSGILAITGAKLGAAQVSASDIDPVAVKVATENVTRNGVTDRVQVFEGDLLDQISTAQYDLVTANIIADVILKLIPRLNRVMNPQTGCFVASGIIDHRLPDIKQALADNGFEIIKIVEDQEWRGVVAKLRFAQMAN